MLGKKKEQNRVRGLRIAGWEVVASSNRWSG